MLRRVWVQRVWAVNGGARGSAGLSSDVRWCMRRRLDRMLRWENRFRTGSGCRKKESRAQGRQSPTGRYKAAIAALYRSNSRQDKNDQGVKVALIALPLCAVRMLYGPDEWVWGKIHTKDRALFVCLDLKSRPLRLENQALASLIFLRCAMISSCTKSRKAMMRLDCRSSSG